MALIALATHLKNHQIQVDLVDFEFDQRARDASSTWEVFSKDAIDKLGESDVKVFGISSLCSNFPVSLLLAHAIRKKWPESKIILGGHQPTLISEETLRKLESKPCRVE